MIPNIGKIFFGIVLMAKEYLSAFVQNGNLVKRLEEIC